MELPEHSTRAGDESLTDDECSKDVALSSVKYPNSPEMKEENNVNDLAEGFRNEEKSNSADIHQLKSVDDISEFEKKSLFSSNCYKVDVCLGVTERAMRLTTAIFDVGDGPNLIIEDVLAPCSRRHIRGFRTSLMSAGDTSFPVKEVVRLQVDLAESVVSNLFGISPVLATEAILGKAFVDEYIKGIEPSYCLMIAKRESPTWILSSLLKNVGSDLMEKQHQDVNRHMCIVTRAKTIPPCSKSPVLLKTEGQETFILKPVERMTTNTELPIAMGINEVVLNRLCWIMVTNMTNLPKLDQKHTKFAEMTDKPTNMVNMVDDFPAEITDDSVNVVPVYKGQVDKDKLFRLQQDVN